MSAAPSFDPYHEWLGIEPRAQPADFYRLLGVARFEPDVARIAAAADQRMALVRSFQTGPRGMYTGRLLNELAAARITLLAPASKATYDAALSQHLSVILEPPSDGPTVLAFGMDQLPGVPATPPVASPPAHRVTPGRELTAAEANFDQELPQPSWRNPYAVMIGVPLVVLLAIVAWGLAQPSFDRPTNTTPGDTEVAGESAEPGPAIPQPAPVQPQPDRPKPPQKILLRQEASGELIFTPATAVRSGGIELQIAGTQEVLAQWLDPAAEVQWRFRLIQPGFFQVEIDYATLRTARGGQLELIVGDQSRTCDLRASGGFDQFHTDTFPFILKKSGEFALVIRQKRQPEGDWLLVRGVRFIPVGRDKPVLTRPGEE